MAESFSSPRSLGDTGLIVGPVGFGASYGAPPSAYEDAFERGCNYFWWGALRRKSMADAIRNLRARGRRDELVVCLQVFWRSPGFLEASARRGLRALGLDYADVLLLGMYRRAPGARVMERAAKMKEAGMFRFLGVSSHRRALFAELAADRRFDVFHLRYSAAHRGAEEEIFAELDEEDRPGIVVFNATKQGRLLDPGATAGGEATPRASDCYRFVLSHSVVDCVTTGPASAAEVSEAVATLARGPMDEEELAWMRRVGDAVHRRARLRSARNARQVVGAVVKRSFE